MGGRSIGESGGGQCLAVGLVGMWLGLVGEGLAGGVGWWGCAIFSTRGGGWGKAAPILLECCHPPKSEINYQSVSPLFVVHCLLQTS